MMPPEVQEDLQVEGVSYRSVMDKIQWTACPCGTTKKERNPNLPRHSYEQRMYDNLRHKRRMEPPGRVHELIGIQVSKAMKALKKARFQHRAQELVKRGKIELKNQSKVTHTS